MGRRFRRFTLIFAAFYPKISVYQRLSASYFDFSDRLLEKSNTSLIAPISSLNKKMTIQGDIQNWTIFGQMKMSCSNLVKLLKELMWTAEYC